MDTNDQGGKKMGFLNGMLGNASTLSKEEASKDLEQILTNGEEIDVAFKLIRDLIVFTDKRLLLVDKQGLTGKKSNTIPFLLRVFLILV